MRQINCAISPNDSVIIHVKRRLQGHCAGLDYHPLWQKFNRKSIVMLFVLLTITIVQLRAQTLIFDRNHFNIVNENGAFRLTAENTHNQYLDTIKSRLSDINLNVSTVVLVQTLVQRSLNQVDQALKSGMAVVQVGQISTEIIQQSNGMIEMAGSDPWLLLFAEDASRQMKNRGIRLVQEVADFVLKEGNYVLMDYEKRDALMRKIILELRVMRALCFSMRQSMYWAKVNGALNSANPYRNFVSQDMRLAQDIMRNYSILKK